MAIEATVQNARGHRFGSQFIGKRSRSQLRLRDMGGIIVVDFIDMKAEHRKKLFNHLRDEMSEDKANDKILPQ